MKELLKVISKKLFIYSFIVNLIYSIADYGQSFALFIFGTSPLTLDKLTKLGVSIILADILMLVFGKIGSYIDNVNEAKATNDIEKYYFNKLQNMTMEKIQNTHTGFIHNLISETASLFVDVIEQCREVVNLQYDMVSNGGKDEYLDSLINIFPNEHDVQNLYKEISKNGGKL